MALTFDELTPRHALDVRSAIKIVLGSGTKNAAGHLLAHEIGSALKRSHAAWQAERTTLCATLEREMRRAFMQQQQQQQQQHHHHHHQRSATTDAALVEITTRHQNLLAVFERDLQDRRRAVCRAARFAFLNWLFTAAGGVMNNETSPYSPVSSPSSQIRDPILPICYGREHAVPVTLLSVYLSDDGASSSSPARSPTAAASLALVANDRNAILFGVSSLESLPLCLPIIGEGDSQIDSKEAAARANAFLTRIGGSDSNGAAFESVLVFIGTREELHERVLAECADWRFDLLPSVEGAPLPRLSQMLQRAAVNGGVTVERVGGFWCGADIVVCLHGAAAEDPAVMREVVFCTATVWQASHLSFAVSQNLSNDGTVARLSDFLASLRSLARESSTSARAMQTTMAPRAKETTPESGASASPSRSTAVYHSIVAMSVRAFLPRYSSGALLKAVTERCGAQVLWTRK